MSKSLVGQFQHGEDDEPNERDAIRTAIALITHYRPTHGLKGSDFDKGMKALQNAFKNRRPR